MEKYQDLIVTLIKNHRRYPGCESILDDIVREVTERAETVIGSIEDESIVTKYLTKIVSAAMITVPKEHNICPAVKKRFHTIQQDDCLPEQSIANPEFTEETGNSQIDENELMESLENSYEPETENTAIYDSIKNSLSLGDDENGGNDEDTDGTEDSITEEAEPEQAEGTTEEDGFVNDFTPVLIDESEISEDLSIEPELDEFEEQEVEPSNDTTEENKAEDAPDSIGEGDVDKELVDKMINGADPQEELNTIAERIEGLSAIYGEKENDAEKIDSVFEEDNAEDVVEEDNKTDENIADELVPDNQNQTEELISETEEISENSIDIEDSTDDILSDLTETEVTEDIDAEDSDFDILSEISGDDDKTADEITEEITENIEEFETSNKSPEIDEPVEQFNPPNLSCFNFKAENRKETDSTELAEAIKNYAEKNTRLPVMGIWKLKFCENKSIDEIASQLEISKGDVLEVVAELVDLAKE